jgi:hypothetical protein
MDRSGFLKLLTRELFPVLRAEGFRGSGTTLRRIAEPIIHVFNFQGSTSAGHCYLNLGAHLSFLPSEGRTVVPFASLMEPHCVFRARIVPPPGPAFGWTYGPTSEQAAETVAFIVSEWSTQGRPFFSRYATYPESFIALLANAHPDQAHARDCLHYARIAAQLNKVDRALAFANAGLAKTPEAASLLREDFNGLLRELAILKKGVASGGVGPN